MNGDVVVVACGVVFSVVVISGVLLIVGMEDVVVGVVLLVVCVIAVVLDAVVLPVGSVVV